MPSHRKRGRPGKRHLPLDWIDPRARFPPWAQYGGGDYDSSYSSEDGGSDEERVER